VADRHINNYNVTRAIGEPCVNTRGNDLNPRSHREYHKGDFISRHIFPMHRKVCLAEKKNAENSMCKDSR
jgi:hypothetical protein